jgi:outer membrane immunogenic protein
MRKRVFVVCAVLAVFHAIGAKAADLAIVPYKAAPPPAFSWTGFYLGGDVGVRSTIADAAVSNATITTPGNVINLLASPSCASPTFFGATPGPCPPNGASLDNSSFQLGPYLGYNWQSNPLWLIGIEADWGWATQTKSLNGAFYPGGAVSLTPLAADSRFSVKTTWDASLRARVGFLAVPNVLLYATAGATWLHAEATSVCPTISCPPPGGATPAMITYTTTRTGWTVGGGLEAHLRGNWLVRGEYRYADYGTWANTDIRVFPLAFSTLSVAYTVRLRTNTTLFGFAYKI